MWLQVIDSHSTHRNLSLSPSQGAVIQNLKTTVLNFSLWHTP